MSRRQWALLLGALPLTALFALFGWALTQTGGNPGGLGVNLKLGESQIISRPAPQFEVMTVDGATASPLALRGKVIMIDFWSSWCGPCRAEAPILSQAYEEYQGKPVEFIGIAIWDNTKDVTKFVDEFNIRYPIAVDPKGLIAIDYGVVRIPVKFFIDGDGKVIRRFEGPMNTRTLKNVLDEMLAKEASSSTRGS